ncbi:phosphatidate cytidylyltransferase [Sedimentitalea sp. JM2-8]|uniref:Phosphatidate cytidylyltransferase n=1 Tax=Sedimentitalea xiamensis TaxID=3050037 RepID=A0ABT7FBQ1_9RHOB|nr:phosphatidate cytidylyltransferase [Sedimentitalea xiamensis]MDK3072537.1 phosphatidate cytidylyltransferase [Sedimentitalea xiamensis]
MSAPDRWSDLTARVGSAVVMAAVGLGAVIAGGGVFHAFIAILCGAMVWELARMLSGQGGRLAVALGALSGLAVMAAIYLPGGYALPILAVPPLIGAVLVRRHRLVLGLFMALVGLAGFEMMTLRDSFGLVWIFWLILIVIMSDVAGYFAGRMLGGPKFWPRVSPKKTWSGTVAGWIGAALIGLVFALAFDTGLSLIPYSVLVAFAAQMGDIAESAVKRMVGVKDSSALIPGHGGLLDRFDGMLGASFFVLLTSVLIGLPPGAV